MRIPEAAGIGIRLVGQSADGMRRRVAIEYRFCFVAPVVK